MRNLRHNTGGQVRFASIFFFISHRRTRTDTDYYLCRHGRDNGVAYGRWKALQIIEDFETTSFEVCACLPNFCTKLRLIYIAKR